jgi:hypothetical protein
MTDTTPAPAGTLVSVKTVTAENIVAALGIERTEATVKAVEQHIGDELAALQSHFAMAVADIQEAYAKALTDTRLALSFAALNKGLTAGVLVTVFLIGAFLGHAL